MMKMNLNTFARMLSEDVNAYDLFEREALYPARNANCGNLGAARAALPGAAVAAVLLLLMALAR